MWCNIQMALEKNTELGKILISDKIFEEAIARFCQTLDLYDNIWLAAKPNVKAQYNEEGAIKVSFSVYVRFGHSIKGLCKELADKLALLISQKSGQFPCEIDINVAGVRSQHLVKRNMDVIVKYDEFGISRIEI